MFQDAHSDSHKMCLMFPAVVFFSCSLASTIFSFHNFKQLGFENIQILHFQTPEVVFFLCSLQDNPKQITW